MLSENFPSAALIIYSGRHKQGDISGAIANEAKQFHEIATSLRSSQ